VSAGAAFLVAWAALLVFGLLLIGATSLAQWLMDRIGRSR
jgi:uncharacterized SAM-binding protein YcdF (DUF218 family)